MFEYEDLSEVPEESLWLELGDAAGLARAELLVELARREADQGRATQAVALLDEATSTAEQVDDLALASHALVAIGGLRFRCGDYPESAAAYRRSAELCRAMGRVGDQALALWGEADALRAAGRWPDALAAAQACRRLAAGESLVELSGDACLIEAKALYYLDREQEALAACAAGRDHYRSVRRTDRVRQVDDFALTIRLYLGDLDEALDLARACHVIALTTKSSDDDAYATRRLADVHLRREEWGQALERADEARALYREADVPIGVARSDVIRGRVLRAQGEHERALEVFTEARVLFDSTGSDEEALHCDTSRAILFHSLGRFRQAAALNRQIIDALADADDPLDTDLPWAVARLADNLLAGEDPEAALGVVAEWMRLGDPEGESGRVARLCLLEVRACALAELDRIAAAAEAAGAALGLTTEEDVSRRTADMYDIRARWLLESGDDRGRADLAHAIALHLAFGSTARAAELSAFFLPDVVSARGEAADPPWPFDDGRPRAG